MIVRWFGCEDAWIDARLAHDQPAGSPVTLIQDTIDLPCGSERYGVARWRGGNDGDHGIVIPATTSIRSTSSLAERGLVGIPSCAHYVFARLMA